MARPQWQRHGRLGGAASGGAAGREAAGRGGIRGDPIEGVTAKVPHNEAGAVVGQRQARDSGVYQEEAQRDDRSEGRPEKGEVGSDPEGRGEPGDGGEGGSTDAAAGAQQQQATGRASKALPAIGEAGQEGIGIADAAAGIDLLH